MTTNASSTSTSNPPAEGEDLFQNFETAFLAMLQPISSQVSSHVYENDEIKANNENIQRFLETVRQLDNFFIRNRALFVAKSPEAVRIEEINDLKNEIAKKEQALQRYSEKLSRWTAKANELVSCDRPSSTKPRIPPAGFPIRPMGIPPSNYTNPK